MLSAGLAWPNRQALPHWYKIEDIRSVNKAECTGSSKQVSWSADAMLARSLDPLTQTHPFFLVVPETRLEPVRAL